MERRLQLEEIGFDICKDDDACEGLALFSDDKELNGYNFLDIISELLNFIKKDFHRKGIKRVFGTCSKNLLFMYKLLDFYPIQKKITKNNEEKYLYGCFIN